MNPAAYLLLSPVTRYFGDLSFPQYGPHTGIDIGVKAWAPIYALRSGVITLDDDDGSYDPDLPATWAGISVKLAADDDSETWWYCHLAANTVAFGQHVEVGEIIGWCGSTGASTAAHLHLERLVNGKAVDPLGRLQELADYITRDEFTQYQQNVRETVESIKAVQAVQAAKIAEHEHGKAENV